MANIKDIDLLNSPLKILLVSLNGLGKSIVAAGFHKQGPVHFEDSDIRMKPIRAYYPNATNITYDSWTSDNFSQFVRKIHDIIDGKFIPSFKTWVLDSMTGFSITSITYQLKVKDKIKTTKGGLPATSWDEINGETVLFHEILEAAQILYTKHNCNIILTAHPIAKTEIVKDEEAKKVISLAAYGNKIPSIIPGFFDEIYNIQMTKTLVDGKPVWGRTLYTVPMDNLPGKTALYQYLPESMDITNKNFYDVLMSYLTKPKA